MYDCCTVLCQCTVSVPAVTVAGGLGSSYLDVRMLYSVQHCTSGSVPALTVAGVLGSSYYMYDCCTVLYQCKCTCSYGSRWVR